jgi:hypothetical protein
MSVSQPATAVRVSLSREERAVLRCAIDYALDIELSLKAADDGEIERTLEEHHESATETSHIAVQPGMDELYKQVFSEYAREIRRTVPQDEFDEADGHFFETAFDGVIDKIKDATGTASPSASPA